MPHLSEHKVRLMSKKQLQSIIERIDKMKIKHRREEKALMSKIMSDSEESEEEEKMHPLKVKKMPKKIPKGKKDESSSSESSASDEE